MESPLPPVSSPDLDAEPEAVARTMLPSFKRRASSLSRTQTMERSVSATALDTLAPLEVGELLEIRNRAKSLFRHTLGRAVLLAMIYLVAKELVPGAMEPGGSLWSLLLVWVCAYHVGHAFDSVGAPKSLGFLVSGALLPRPPGPSAPH